MSYAVVAENLTKRIGDFTAVDSVSFQVPQGEIFGFLGSNGAGKTTTIRMLCGIIAPTEGSGTVLGMDIVRDRNQISPSVISGRAGSRCRSEISSKIRRRSVFCLLRYYAG